MPTFQAVLVLRIEVAMGRFYFHLRVGEETLTDDEGRDFLDLSAARHEAVLAARELVAEAIMSGEPEVAGAFVIADDAGRSLATVPLATVLPRPLKK